MSDDDGFQSDDDINDDTDEDREDDGSGDLDPVGDQEYVASFGDGGPTSQYQQSYQHLLPSPDIEGIGKRTFLTPDQRVAIDINRFLGEITDSPEDLDSTYGPMMKQLADAFERDPLGLKLGAKNPWALVLGYLVYDNHEVAVKKFKEVTARYLSDVPDEAGVKPEDVLRYSFFWEGFQKRFLS